MFDQRPVDARCLTFTSAPLSSELEVTGPVKAVLYGMSSAPDTDWVVRLTDVHPDGYSRPLCDGILRGRYRESFEHPRLLDPGKIYRFEVDLWATSNVFLEFVQKLHDESHQPRPAAVQRYIWERIPLGVVRIG